MKYKAMINHVIQLKKEKPILMWAGTILDHRARFILDRFVLLLSL